MKTNRSRKSGGLTAETSAIPMNYPGFVYRTLVQDGHDLETLLAGTDLRPEQFSDPYFRTEFVTVRRFLMNALELTGDPHLGPRLAMRFEAHFIGPPAYVALNAPRMIDGLTVIERFIRLTFPAMEFTFSTTSATGEPGQAEVRVRPMLPLGDISYFVISSALVVINNLLLEMLRAPIVATRVETVLSEPEGWADIAAHVTRVPVYFNCEFNRLVFPAALLDEALPCADAINHKRLIEICERAVSDMAVEKSAVSRVLSFLEIDQNFSASLSDAARALGYSERGLRRQLEDSGTTYRTLKDEARQVRARELLANRLTPIQLIAQDLGYDSASNFARSFKRWTGLSPKAFRDAFAGRRRDGDA